MVYETFFYFDTNIFIQSKPLNLIPISKLVRTSLRYLYVNIVWEPLRECLTSGLEYMVYTLAIIVFFFFFKTVSEDRNQWTKYIFIKLILNLYLLVCLLVFIGFVTTSWFNQNITVFYSFVNRTRQPIAVQ